MYDMQTTDGTQVHFSENIRIKSNDKKFFSDFHSFFLCGSDVENSGHGKGVLQE